MLRCLAKTVLFAVISTALLCADSLLAGEITCNVTYLSSEHVYLNAGSKQGLSVGLKGHVVRNGEAIAELEIVFVAGRSASCVVVGGGQEILVGDNVVCDVHGLTPPEAVPSPTFQRRTRAVERYNAAARKPEKPRLRGSIALQWDHGEETVERDLQTDVFRLPFRLHSPDVWRSFSFYTRGSLRRLARKGFGSATPDNEWRNRIQELAFVRTGRELNWHFAVGRIGSRVTNAAGPFDGVRVSRRSGAGTRIGLFGGFAPEWGNLGFGTEDHVIGADFHFNQRTDSGRVLDMVVAGIGRYSGGEISREYVTMATTWRGTGGLSLLQAAEVDLNRGWRRDAGTSSVVLSSVALSGRYRFSRQLSANIGFDNRDPVRTWESRSLPDSLFQNAGRKGYRLGVRMRPLRRVTVNLSGSLRKDDRSDENITSWNARVSAPGVFLARMTVFGSVRGFDGPWLTGLAPTLGLAATTLAGIRTRVEGGSYRYTGKIDDSTRDNTWATLGVSKDLTRTWSTMVEYRQDWGDDVAGRRWFIEVRRRF